MLSVIGTILLILVLLFLILPLIVRKDYVIEKQVQINKPNDAVFDYVKRLANQAYYNKWVMADPNVNRTARGEDGTVGYVSAWDSQVKSVGKGEQEITHVTVGSLIDSTVRFERPFKNTASVQMTTEATTPGQTLLTWKMNGHSKYPMNITNLFVPGMLGKDMAESLSNLKRILEK